MVLYFITLSLLIIAVLGVRAVFKRSVSPRLIYVLWIAVVIRLCLPISLIEADFLTVLTENNGADIPAESVTADETETAEESEVIEESAPETVMPEIEYVMPEGNYAPAMTLPTPAVTVPAPDQPSENYIAKPDETEPDESAEIIAEPEFEEVPEAVGEEDCQFELSRILIIVWLCGAAGMAVWFTVSGCVFRYRLCRDRRLYDKIGITKIYISSSVGAPCLSGLIPAIYITPEAAENPSKEFVILHEYTHLRHLDHLWSAVRIAALCVHWFNPLVWAAAIISKQDAELACDDSICSRLGEEKRFEYARVLIDTIPQKHRYATGLGSAPMKQRIMRLTKRQKNHLICAFLAAVLIVTAVGCSFVGLRKVTYENIIEQKGFTILSQELRTVEINLDMDELPTYEELYGDYADNDLYAGAEWISDGITVAEEGMSRIVLKSVKNSVTLDTVTDDEITLTFEIEQDLREDEGTLLAVYYLQNTDGEITKVICFYNDHTLYSENGDYPKIIDTGPSDSDNRFSVRIPAEIYAELTGTVSFGVLLNEIEYVRGDEVREYGAKIFAEDELILEYREKYKELADQKFAEEYPEAYLKAEYEKCERDLYFHIDEYETRKAELKSNNDLLEVLLLEKEKITAQIAAVVPDEAMLKFELEEELNANRAKADAVNGTIAQLTDKCDFLLAEIGEIIAKMAEMAAQIESLTGEPYGSGVEKLPAGHIETAQISYTPIVYEITQEMEIAEITEDDIDSILIETVIDGTRIFLYKSADGSSCAGYEKDGKLYRFLVMTYADGMAQEYALEEFDSILEHDGFAVEWSWSHGFRYYYTLRDGVPDIFLPAGGDVIETDFDRDGVIEVISSQTSYSTVYDIYAEAGEEDGGKFVSTAKLNDNQDKTGYIYKYDPENGYFVFTCRKDDDDSVYHRYGAADGNVLTVVTPFDDVDIAENDGSAEMPEPDSPVDVTYMNTDRAVNTVLVPLSGVNPGYYAFSYDQRFTIFVTYDRVMDRYGEYIHTDAKIVVVNNVIGKITLEEEIDDFYNSPSISYGPDSCYIYSAGLTSGGEYRMNYAYKVDFSGESITVTDWSDEYDWYAKWEEAVYSPDGKTAAVMVSDNESNDGGLDIRYPDGRVERVFDSNLTAYDINDIISYIPVGFADNTHLVYTMGGWEWSRGYGIYDTETGENVLGNKDYRILGVFDGGYYAAYENDGRHDYGISKMEIWRITLDGEETLIAATHDVPEGVHQLSMKEYLTYNNGVWVIYETGEIDGWSSSSLPENGIIGARVMSADFSAVLLEFDFYFDWSLTGVPSVTDNAFTISCPVIYEDTPSEANIVSDVIYRCDDVYILDDTTVHGEFSVTFPNGTGDYRIRNCKVLLCDDGCDLTDVVSRAVWGYAPAYRIDQYEEFEATDGWSYPGRQYFNIVPEETAAEVVSQMTAGGASEAAINERLGNRRYIWLLDLGDDRYLFTVLEAKNYNAEKPENESEIVNDIMRSALVEVREKKLSALELFRDQNPDYFEDAYPQFTVNYTKELTDGSALIYFSRGGLPHGLSEAHFCLVSPDGSFADLTEDEDNKKIIEDTSLYYATAAHMSDFVLSADETKLTFSAEWFPIGSDVGGWKKCVELDLETGKMKDIIGGELLWDYALSDEYTLYYTISENGAAAFYYESAEAIFNLTDLDAEMIRHGSSSVLPSVLPIYSNRTDSGFEVCLSYTSHPYYFVLNLFEAGGSLTYNGIADIDELTAIENPAYEEKTVTVRSLDELQYYNSRYIISDSLYAFYFDLLSGNSLIPEFRTLRINDYEITFTVPVQRNTTYFTFTVESSELDTLPPGEYYREVQDLMNVMMTDPNDDSTDPFADIPEVQKLRTFISGTYIWNTPTYGEGTEYPGIHNYICRYYGIGEGLPYDDYRRIAADEFGVTDFYALGTMDFILDSGMIYSGGIGGTWRGDVTDVLTEGDITTVVMQYYADASCLLESYKVGYKFGSDGRWLGYEIIENSDYEPYGLHYVSDEASGGSDPQVERFMPYYDKALTVMQWFTGIGSITVPSSEIREFYGYDYAEVKTHAFTENCITDMDSMRKYLGTVFADNMVDELMAKCADESYVPVEGERNLPVFVFRDGKVWINGSAGGFREYSAPEYYMNEVTESEAELALRIYRITYDQVAGTYVRDENGELYLIRFVKSGDTWLCGEFQVFW